MARYSVVFWLVILCSATCSFAAVATDKWQQELEMKLDDKINKVKTRNVQLEDKVNQLESQLEDQRVLNISLSFIFLFIFYSICLVLGIRIILAFQ